MKKVNNVTILLVLFFVITTVANANSVRTEFKEFQITPVEDLHVGKNVKAIWTVRYSQNEAPVTVVKRKTIEGIEYVVQGEYFAVSYVASGKGFGAKEVRKSWSNVPRKINNAVICTEQLARQQIITPKPVDDKLALGLIASYLPELINADYRHLLK